MCSVISDKGENSEITWSYVWRLYGSLSLFRRHSVPVGYSLIMQKKRTSKASLRRDLLAKERERMEKVADQMTSLVMAIDVADQASIDVAEAVDALKALDKSVADIEQATGISAKRINQLRRNAGALLNESDEESETDQEETSGTHQSDRNREEQDKGPLQENSENSET